MNKRTGFISILIPSATVFVSSACIMIIELVAGRLIARHLGSSLYTWTSIIGVVLAGITIGNWLGGRIADRFTPRKTLAVLFAVSSVACVLIVILNNLVGTWMWLWKLNWPAHIFVHVSLVFLIPSTLLGTISPVVAKGALDKGLPTGRTVGNIYAWGAAGSIAGTFLAGFYLIAAMGTIAIIWTVGTILLLMAILYWAKLWVLYVWAAIFIALMTMGMAPAQWAKDAGPAVGLRERPDPTILYEDETQYCYVGVKRISNKPDIRLFMQDKLKHSEIVIGDINNLKYSYEQIHAAITHRFARDREQLSTLIIGGGGYVFPRYIEENWPGSRVDVVEIDPGVTEAAMQAFGLSRDTSINTITLDARNYVDELLKKKNNGRQIPQYDFIYEDALNDYSIPFQLVTKEFNDKIAQILKDDGVYMIELIDIFDSGLFLGAYVNTLQETFTHVYVITTSDVPRSGRNTFVIAAAKCKLNLENLEDDYKQQKLELWYLNESDMTQLKENSRGVIITDDYAPVENMLAPVVKQSAVDFLSGKYLNQAKELSKQGKFERSLKKYRELIKLDPTQAVLSYNNMGLILAKQGKIEKAIDTFRKALKAEEEAEIKGEVEGVHFSLGLLLKKTGDAAGAKKHLNKAVEGFRRSLAKKPNSAKLAMRLGDSLAEIGDFNEASKAFTKAVALNPFDPAIRMKLVQSLEFQGKIKDAIAVLRNGISFMIRYNRKEPATKFQAYIQYLENKKASTED